MIVNRKPFQLQLQTSEVSRFLAFWIFPAMLLFVHILYWFVMLRHAHFFTANSFFLDFDSYRHLLLDALAGVNPYTVSYMRTLGPPQVMFVYIPFLLFPFHLSQFLFFLVSAIGLYTAAWVVLRASHKKKWRHLLLWSLVILLPFPTRFSLLMGQPGGLSALLVAFFVTSASAWVQAISLLLLSTVKTFYLVMLAALPFKRLRVVIAGFVLLTIASFSIFVPRWYGTYFRGSLIHTITAQTGSVTLDYYNQSLRSTLTRLHVANLYPGAVLALGALVLILLVSTHDRALAMLLSLLVSPVIWQHYLVAVFPIWLLLILRSKQTEQRITLLVIFVALSVQIAAFQTAPVTIANALLASHEFFGLCALSVYCVLLSPEALRRLKTWLLMHFQFQKESTHYSEF